MGTVGGIVSAPIPTRWVTRIRAQLADADRRLALAAQRLQHGEGSRALQEAFPGVMAAALARVWMTDEPWHRARTVEAYGQMVRSELPSGFLTLAELRAEAQGFAGWRAEDARPLVDQARAFVSAVRGDLDRRLAPPRGAAGGRP